MEFSQLHCRFLIAGKKHCKHSTSSGKSSGMSSSSVSSHISTQAIENILETLKQQRHRDSTHQNYYHIWKSFNNFFIQLDIKPKNWEDRLMLYVGYLIDNKKKSSTVRSYVSAIKAVLFNGGFKIMEDTVLINALTRACRLKNDSVKPRLPVRKDLLVLLCKSIDDMLFSEQPYLAILYKTMFTVTYFGLLRVGEATRSRHVIKAKDMHVGTNKKKLMLVLHSLKTHNESSKPQIIKIDAIDQQHLQKVRLGQDTFLQIPCPFQLLQEYIDSRCRY